MLSVRMYQLSVGSNSKPQMEEHELGLLDSAPPFRSSAETTGGSRSVDSGRRLAVSCTFLGSSVVGGVVFVGEVWGLTFTGTLSGGALATAAAAACASWSYISMLVSGHLESAILQGFIPILMIGDTEER